MVELMLTVSKGQAYLDTVLATVFLKQDLHYVSLMNQMP